MSATATILDSVRLHVQQALPDISVELFPDNPAAYRFMHPKGAVLIAYQGGKYKKLEDIGMVVQERQLTLYFTVFSRSLHGEAGGQNLLDALRLALTGFEPYGCSPAHLIDDGFLAENGGTWQHFLRVQTECEQVQVAQDKDLPKFAAMHLRQSTEPLEPDLKPQQP